MAFTDVFDFEKRRLKKAGFSESKIKEYRQTRTKKLAKLRLEEERKAKEKKIKARIKSREERPQRIKKRLSKVVDKLGKLESQDRSNNYGGAGSGLRGLVVGSDASNNKRKNRNNDFGFI